jgi:hypothetical protein
MRSGLALAMFCLGRLTAADLQLVGSAELLSGRLRLTPSVMDSVGAAWYSEKQAVGGGFTATFQFQLTDQQGVGPGADGFAFVLQNSGPNAIGNRGSAGGFGLGELKRYKNGRGIPRSLAVFFDAFHNEGDPSDNYIAICTNGTVKKMRWPPPRAGMTKLMPFRLKDGKVHDARVTYKPPFLSVWLDDGREPVLSLPVDLAAVTDENGKAWVGFTASTGSGFQNHDILNWSLVADSSSGMTSVDSSVQFLEKVTCMEGRNLCTPKEAVVEEQGGGTYHVILPGHVAWAASVPNPGAGTVTLGNLRGYVCRGTAGSQICESADAAAVTLKNEGGRTWFSVAKMFPDNQGFFEFDASVQR